MLLYLVLGEDSGASRGLRGETCFWYKPAAFHLALNDAEPLKIDLSVKPSTFGAMSQAQQTPVEGKGLNIPLLV